MKRTTKTKTTGKRATTSKATKRTRAARPIVARPEDGVFKTLAALRPLAARLVCDVGIYPITECDRLYQAVNQAAGITTGESFGTSGAREETDDFSAECVRILKTLPPEARAAFLDLDGAESDDNTMKLDAAYLLGVAVGKLIAGFSEESALSLAIGRREGTR